MIKKFSLSECLEEGLHHHCFLLNQAGKERFTNTVQFQFSDNQNNFQFYISSENDKTTLHHGFLKSADVTIFCHPRFWFNSIKKSSLLFWYILGGKIKIKGNRLALLNYFKLLGQRIQPFSKFELPAKHYDKSLANNEWFPPKEVLIINASPRIKNGYTDYFLTPFAEGIAEAGAKIEQVNLYDEKVHISDCVGCFDCFINNVNQCVHDDKTFPLIEKISNASLVIFATPLYCSSVPSKLKQLMEHIMPTLTYWCESNNNMSRYRTKKPIKGNMVLFSVGSYPEPEHFDGLIENFKMYAHYFHKTLLASIIRPAALFFAEDTSQYYGLQETMIHLKTAGTLLIQKGAIPKKLLKKIASLYNMSPKTWRLFWNIHWFYEESARENLVTKLEHR